MTAMRIRVQEVVSVLGRDGSRWLRELRAEGLFEEEEISPEQAEELRVAVELMRDLGVNAAGVEVVLRLRSRLLVLEERTALALRRLLEDREAG